MSIFKRESFVIPPNLYPTRFEQNICAFDWSPKSKRRLVAANGGALVADVDSQHKLLCVTPKAHLLQCNGVRWFPNSSGVWQARAGRDRKGGEIKLNGPSLKPLSPAGRPWREIPLQGRIFFAQIRRKARTRAGRSRICSAILPRRLYNRAAAMSSSLLRKAAHPMPWLLVFLVTMTTMAPFSGTMVMK